MFPHGVDEREELALSQPGNWGQVHIRDCEIWKYILRLQPGFFPAQLFREATWTWAGESKV